MANGYAGLRFKGSPATEPEADPVRADGDVRNSAVGGSDLVGCEPAASPACRLCAGEPVRSLRLAGAVPPAAGAAPYHTEPCGRILPVSHLRVDPGHGVSVRHHAFDGRAAAERRE